MHLTMSYIGREVYAMYAETYYPTLDSLLARLKKEEEDGKMFISRMEDHFSNILSRFWRVVGCNGVRVKPVTTTQGQHN